MTHLPFPERVEVQAAEGPKYKVGPKCARPGCFRWAEQTHHIVRRSAIGAADWVKYDGKLIGNLTGLCVRCHAELTENRARLSWTGTGFVWVIDSGSVAGFIDPQPPVIDMSAPDPGPVGPAASPECPSCHRPMPRPKPKNPEEKRPRKSWSIHVPVDRREDGADVLDTLLDACRELFGHGEERNLRYHTLVQALALVVQHGHRLVRDE